jgi:hypothetical protein
MKICHFPRQEAYGGVESTALLILKLGTKWRCGHLHAPANLPPEITPVPTEYEDGWATRSVYTLWKRENLLPLTGFERRTVQPVTYTLHHV